MSKDLLKSNVDLFILKVLMQKDMHGYEMMKAIEKQSDGKFILKAGTLYPVLHALEEKGVIEGRWDDSTGDRKRKIYKITEIGTQHFHKKEEEWLSYSGAMNKLLMGGVSYVYA